MRVRYLEPEFVESFPTPLEQGVLYVSIEFTTCAHLCACGCGEEVITPLSPAQWSLTYNGHDVSLHPSVGNWSLSCKSHYVIDHGSIRWSHQFTKGQIAANRARDRRALEGHASNSQGVAEDSDQTAGAVTGWTRLRTRFSRWLGIERAGHKRRN